MPGAPEVSGVGCRISGSEDRGSRFQDSGIYLTESMFKVVSQKTFPHKTVNLFYTLVIIKDKWTDL